MPLTLTDSSGCGLIVLSSFTFNRPEAGDSFFLYSDHICSFEADSWMSTKSTSVLAAPTLSHASYFSC